jgi:hypothetical protein
VSQQALGFGQREISIGAPRPESPKTIIFKLFREESASLSFDKLLGYQAVLEREGTRYLSSPLKGTDSDLNCMFSDVPPGTYKLKMDIFRLSTSLTISAKPVRTISFDIRIGQAITITEAPPVK